MLLQVSTPKDDTRRKVVFHFLAERLPARSRKLPSLDIFRGAAAALNDVQEIVSLLDPRWEHHDRRPGPNDFRLADQALGNPQSFQPLCGFRVLCQHLVDQLSPQRLSDCPKPDGLKRLFGVCLHRLGSLAGQPGCAADHLPLLPSNQALSTRLLFGLLGLGLRLGLASLRIGPFGLLGLLGLSAPATGAFGSLRLEAALPGQQNGHLGLLKHRKEDFSDHKENVNKITHGSLLSVRGKRSEREPAAHRS